MYNNISEVNLRHEVIGRKEGDLAVILSTDHQDDG